MTDRRGQVWEAMWAAYPRQLLLVIHEDAHTTWLVDLETLERYEWIARDLGGRPSKKLRTRRVA